MSNTTTTISIAARMNRLPIGRTHRNIIMMGGLGYFFDVFDIMLASVLAAVLDKTFHLSTGLLSFTVAASFIGMFIGSLAIGNLSDRFGRRFGFFFNLLVYSTFTLLGAFSMNAWWLIATRIVAGIGIGSQFPLVDTYLNDMLPGKARGRYFMIAFTIGMTAYPIVAALSFGLATSNFLGIAGWRWMFVLGALGAVIAWLFQRKLIESPRWLESVGRSAEAEKLVAQLEAESIDVLGKGASLPTPEADSAPVIVSDHPWALIFSKGIRRRTLMIYVADFFQTVGFYGFGTIAVLVLVSKHYTITSSLLYTFLVFIGYPIGSWLTVYISDTIERKWILCITALAMIGLGLAFAYSSSPELVVTFGFVYAIVSELFANSIHMFQAEIFPTAARATGSGSAYSLSRASQVILPFTLIPVLDAAGAVPVFGIVGLCMAVLIVDVAVFGPRTARRTVEEVSVAADVVGKLQLGVPERRVS